MEVDRVPSFLDVRNLRKIVRPSDSSSDDRTVRPQI